MMGHSPWQPQGVHGVRSHGLFGTGSEPCFCRQEEGINAWNGDNTYLRQISDDNTRQYGHNRELQLRYELVILHFWTKVKEIYGQGQTNSFNK